LRATAIRFSVPSSCAWRSRKFWFAFRSGYFSTVTSRRESALDSSPWAASNFRNASGSFTSSGVTWMLVALARACTTASSVLFSKSAAPFTLATRFGIRSARRWYWLPTSAQAAFTCSSACWIVL
jgi:hypothetical protein